MPRLALGLSCLLALSWHAFAANPAPIVTTITVPTSSVSLATITSAGVRTSIIPGSVTLIVSIVNNNPVTLTSTLPDQTSVMPFTSTGISSAIINTNMIIVSTIGSSAASTSDNPATKTAQSSSATTSTTSITDAPNLSSITSSSVSSTDTASTDSQSQSSTLTTSTLHSLLLSSTSPTPTAAVHQTQPSGGSLTSAQKAGIGVGSALGAVLLLILVAVIILWRHGLLSRKMHKDDVFDENEDFLHRPYSMLFNQKKQIEVNHEKPEDVTQQHMAYGPNARLSSNGLSGSTIHEEQTAEQPTYLAVPTHFSGQRRWSKVPQHGEA